MRDAITGAFPVVSYWKQTLILSDNRIPAFASDISTYGFALPANGSTITVEAELLFRRIFQEEIDARDWDVTDIRMEEAAQTLLLEPACYIFFPVIVR